MTLAFRIGGLGTIGAFLDGMLVYNGRSFVIVIGSCLYSTYLTQSYAKHFSGHLLIFTTMKREAGSAYRSTCTVNGRNQRVQMFHPMNLYQNSLQDSLVSPLSSSSLNPAITVLYNRSTRGSFYFGRIV